MLPPGREHRHNDSNDTYYSKSLVMIFCGFPQWSCSQLLHENYKWCRHLIFGFLQILPVSNLESKVNSTTSIGSLPVLVSFTSHSQLKKMYLPLHKIEQAGINLVRVTLSQGALPYQNPTNRTSPHQNVTNRTSPYQNLLTEPQYIRTLLTGPHYSRTLLKGSHHNRTLLHQNHSVTRPHYIRTTLYVYLTSDQHTAPS